MDQASTFLTHKYPDNVKLLNDPLLTHLCSKLSQNDCKQPQFNRWVKKVFQQIFYHILNNEWPRDQVTHATRMTDIHPEVEMTTENFTPQQRAVCVDIARAGMVPSQLFFDELCELVDEKGLRQDHIFASRMTNNEGEVTHTELSSSKVGGDVDQAILLIPDPMGATGSSLCQVIDYYKEQVEGTPSKIIAAHMIITPEYIRKLSDSHPEVVIYAARLDRGFSSAKALKSTPGEFWDEESGLNDSQYIVPGAGGVGEIINNSFV